jgi:pSer/pThr/pTyr-binding forkhead associated (FHA) protein
MPRVCINVTGKNSQPYRFSLDRKIVRLGRAADNDIIVDCPSVSSHHCEMRRVSGGYTLQDLDSTNGIKLDDARMEVIDLENDTEITVGDAEMEFELTDDERSSLDKEDHTPHRKAKLPPLDDTPDDPGESPDEPADEEEAPRKKPERKKSAKKTKMEPASAPVLVHTSHPGGAANFFVTMVFLCLSVVAFFFGMSLKHSAETKEAYPPNGRSLWNDIFNKSAAVETSGTAEGDGAEPPGE